MGKHMAFFILQWELRKDPLSLADFILTCEVLSLSLVKLPERYDLSLMDYKSKMNN